jgi:hypothetical protein
MSMALRPESLETPGLDDQLTDDGEIVSLMHWLRFTPQEDFWYSFLLDAESTPGP